MSIKLNIREWFKFDIHKRMENADLGPCFKSFMNGSVNDEMRDKIAAVPESVRGSLVRSLDRYSQHVSFFFQCSLTIGAVFIAVGVGFVYAILTSAADHQGRVLELIAIYGASVLLAMFLFVWAGLRECWRAEDFAEAIRETLDSPMK